MRDERESGSGVGGRLRSDRGPLRIVVCVTLVAGGMLLAGCGGSGEAASRASAGDQAVEPAAASGVEIPVDEPSGPPDGTRADRGAQVFSARGCVACHYVGRGERLVGPDLAGVNERRSFTWFYSMVMNPDSMTRNDSIARSLLLEYMTPMPYQGVQPDEVPDLWDFLRRSGTEPTAP